MTDPTLIYQLNAINTLQIGQLVYLDNNDNQYKPTIATALDSSFARGYVTGFLGNDKFYLQPNISFASYGNPLPDSWFNYFPSTTIVNPNDPNIGKVPGNVGDPLYVSESISGSFQTSVPSGNVALVGYKTSTGFLFRPSLDPRLFSPITSLKTSADCATTTTIPLSGEQTIDGITTAASRVLVKNQTVASQNGLYNSSIGVWVRSDDGDYGTDLDYCNVFVNGGLTQGGIWVSTGYGYLIGVSNINFIRISSNTTAQSISGIQTQLTSSSQAISAIQTQIVAISSSVVTLQNKAPINSALISGVSGISATNYVINFTDVPSIYVLSPLRSNVTFTTLNKVIGRRVDLNIKDDGTSRTLVSPSGWNWVTTIPVSSTPNKWVQIKLTTTSTLDSGIVAEYRVQS